MPVPQHRRRHRRRRPPARVQFIDPRSHPPTRTAGRRGWAAVPLRGGIGGRAAALVAAQGTHARASAGREENRVTETRPYYVPVGNEEQVFKAACQQGLSILLKGPTGCGKTRFIEAMAYDMSRPLITVACHDDLTTADLVGRFLLKGGDTAWVDGPLTRAVREGAICYLDEIVEARTRLWSCTPSPIIAASCPSTASASPSTPPPGSASSCPTTPGTKACS